VAKVLLVHPLFLADDGNEVESASPYFPLGVLYLAAYARDRGHDVEVFDGTFSAGEHDFDAALGSAEPDVVAVSVVLPTRVQALRLGAVASNRGCLTIFGGPDPTALPREYAAEPSVDIVVHHEGEITFARLLDLFDAGSLGPGQRSNLTAVLANEPGVAFEANGRVAVNPPPTPIADLDSLPSPARDLIDVQRYLEHWKSVAGYSSLTLSSTRGCSVGCEWCADAVHGNKWRQREPESVAAEVVEIVNTYDIDRLRLVDDVDSIDRDWLEHWAGALANAGTSVGYEALNDLERTDLPMLEVQDGL
jgi:anaerobic magnesium-protoporphyrin IX monomethyl ester cyclase